MHCKPTCRCAVNSIINAGRLCLKWFAKQLVALQQSNILSTLCEHRLLCTRLGSTAHCMQGTMPYFTAHPLAGRLVAHQPCFECNSVTVDSMQAASLFGCCRSCCRLPATSLLPSRMAPEATFALAMSARAGTSCFKHTCVHWCSFSVPALQTFNPQVLLLLPRQVLLLDR
jgi:hypothetical protein